jgi:hypothetical protein
MFPVLCNTITITQYYLKQQQQKQNKMTTITLTDSVTGKSKTSTTSQDLKGAMEVFQDRINGRIVGNKIYGFMQERTVCISFS